MYSVQARSREFETGVGQLSTSRKAGRICFTPFLSIFYQLLCKEKSHMEVDIFEVMEVNIFKLIWNFT